jgi:hypothetical protein
LADRRYSDYRHRLGLLQRSFRAVGVPEWRDEEAVVAWVAEEIIGEPFLREYHGPEKAAVQAALCGNIGLLNDLVQRSLEGRLSPDTCALVGEFFTGKRNPHTGKLKGERGPRRKLADERRATNPVHDAADAFPIVLELLRHAYPEQAQAALRDRALQITADLNFRTDAEALNVHMRRSKNDRRRLK